MPLPGWCVWAFDLHSPEALIDGLTECLEKWLTEIRRTVWHRQQILLSPVKKDAKLHPTCGRKFGSMSARCGSFNNASKSVFKREPCPIGVVLPMLNYYSGVRYQTNCCQSDMVYICIWGGNQLVLTLRMHNSATTHIGQPHQNFVHKVGHGNLVQAVVVAKADYNKLLIATNVGGDKLKHFLRYIYIRLGPSCIFDNQV